MKKRGFTLIELLVVVSVIAILAAVGIAAFTGATKRARDSRRKADMKSIQDAFESYYAIYNKYPARVTSGGRISIDGRYFLIPSDPKTGSYYTWTGNNTTRYCYCARLEETTKGNSSNSTCNFVRTGAYFCVQNRQ